VQRLINAAVMVIAVVIPALHFERMQKFLHLFLLVGRQFEGLDCNAKVIARLLPEHDEAKKKR
jgi:hypothetical protein